MTQLLEPALRAQTFPEGLYIHLPFCAAICTYCDFSSETYAAGRAQRYLTALENEMRVRVGALQLSEPYAPRTIFLGGGTPSALNIPELEKFFELLRRYVDWTRTAEFTIEANPGSTDAAKLEFLLKQGVKRISFGVQSFQPHLLKLLGRVHGADQGREAVALARKAGYSNISIDLMHGLPTQKRDDLRRDLDEAIALGTEHISAYGLIYEDGTPLTQAVQRGVVGSLSEEEEGAQYTLVMETLEQAGLPQYEVSNYARPGFEAQHNLIYWRNEAYLGLGVSAASFVDFKRSTNFYEMDRYMAAAEKDGIAIASSETLDKDARARESLVLELRLRRGVDAADFARRWGLDFSQHPAIAKFMREGLMERTPEGRYRISRQGMPVADGILAELV
ncbi:MAG TPA: radical SAM family heme chaperone HemW [Planctomycetota bacterium]|nr:radical SAM family heme chaperone HemW [Planctomycetota bacterium]